MSASSPRRTSAPTRGLWASHERVSRAPAGARRRNGRTSVASVNEISVVSPEGFEAAIREALDRANKTLRNVQGAWVKDMNVIKDMNVMIEDGNITGYKVDLGVTFVLEDGA